MQLTSILSEEQLNSKLQGQAIFLNLVLSQLDKMTFRLPLIAIYSSPAATLLFAQILSDL